MIRKGKPVSEQIKIVVSFVMLFSGAFTAGVTEVEASAYYHEISLPSLNKEQLVVFPLISDVYEVADENYTNVCIVEEEDGEYVPRLIRKKLRMTERTIEKKHSAAIRNLDKKENNSISLLVNMPEDLGPIHGLKLDTPLRDYERSVSVYGQSAAGDSWEKIVSKELLYDYSRFADVRKNRLTFPEKQYSALRIDIHAVTDVQASRLMKLRETFEDTQKKERTETKTLERRPFRVDSVHVFVHHTEEEVEAVVTKNYSPESWSIDKNRADEPVVRVSTNREPLTQLRVKTESRNFSRPVVLKAGSKDDNRILARQTLYDLSYRDFRKNRTTVKFNETRTRHLRLLPEKVENTPLPIEDIELRGHVYETVFLAKPGKSYRLTFSAKQTEASMPDNTVIKELVKKDFSPVPATLKPRRKDTASTTFSLRDFLSSKLFFIIVIVLMVAVLSLALYSTWKQV